MCAAHAVKSSFDIADVVTVPAALRWGIAGLLMWGLFTGLAYVLVPFLTDGWGNDLSFVVGLVLIGVCGALLLRFDPRAR